MWIAAPFGFLMPAIRPPKTVEPGDDRTLQVRARRAKDLDILRAEYMKGKLGPTIHTPDFDYEYRAYCTPEAFAFASMQMIMEINYTKFKPTTLDWYRDHQLHKVYNEMWSVLLSGLSTRRHQDEYWGKSTKRGKHRRSSTKTTSGSSTVYRVTGSGYPKLVEPDNGSVTPLGEAVDGALVEYDRYQKWLREHADPRERDCSATRDEAARVPDVFDGEWTEDDIANSVDAIDSVLDRVDRLNTDIAAILADGRRPIDHTVCQHADSAAARGRCKARRRKADLRTVAFLREQIADAWKAAEDAATAADSDDPDAWKGYPWDRNPRPDAVVN